MRSRESSVFSFPSFAFLVARKDRLHLYSARMHRWEVVSVVFSCRFLTFFPLSGSFQGIPPRLAKSSFQLTLNTRAIPLSYVGVERTTESVRHQQFLVSFSSVSRHFSKQTTKRKKICGYQAETNIEIRMVLSVSHRTPIQHESLTRFLSFLSSRHDILVI